MAEQIREVMTEDPLVVQKDATLREAAVAMAGQNIGDVLVMDGDDLRGILTDRDIVVRAVAENKDADATTVGSVATTTPYTVTPDADVGEAIRIAREHNVRRVPVVDGGKPVGIVTLGDLAVQRDPDSALADVSEAPPNN